MAKTKVKIDFSDIRDYEKRLRKEVKESENRTKIGLLKAVTLVHREAVNNTKAGVKYFDGIYNTGNLRRALSFDLISPVAGQVFISKGLDYPKFVEYGTRRMRAKPFLTPAVYENIKAIEDIFTKLINETIKKLSK
jgi:HK97 gp10 family phage protein